MLRLYDLTNSIIELIEKLEIHLDNQRRNHRILEGQSPLNGGFLGRFKCTRRPLANNLDYGLGFALAKTTKSDDGNRVRFIQLAQNKA